MLNPCKNSALLKILPTLPAPDPTVCRSRTEKADGYRVCISSGVRGFCQLGRQLSVVDVIDRGIGRNIIL